MVSGIHKKPRWPPVCFLMWFLEWREEGERREGAKGKGWMEMLSWEGIGEGDGPLLHAVLFSRPTRQSQRRRHKSPISKWKGKL